MQTKTIQINGKFFKVSEATMTEIDLIVSDLYGSCTEELLVELNNLLGKILWNNPSTDPVEDIPNFEYIL